MADSSWRARAITTCSIGSNSWRPLSFCLLVCFPLASVYFHIHAPRSHLIGLSLQSNSETYVDVFLIFCYIRSLCSLTNNISNNINKLCCSDQTEGYNPADPLFQPTCSECFILVGYSSVKTHNHHTAFNRSPCFLCRSLLIFIRQCQPSINQFVYCAATVIWVECLSCSYHAKNVPAASVDSAENLIHWEFCVLGGMTAHRHFNMWHPGVACRPRFICSSAFLRRACELKCFISKCHKK